MMFLVTVVIAGGCGVGTADTASAKLDIGTAKVSPDYLAPFYDNTSVASTTNVVASTDIITNYPSSPYKIYATPRGTQNITGKQGATQHIKTIKMKVGPDTAVHVPIFNSDSATRTIYVSWNYCGVSF